MASVILLWTSLRFACTVAPIIDRNFERVYNVSDNVTCSAEGLPAPTVTWKRISGSMPEQTVNGRREAVLKNLENGFHIWVCTAVNEVGSDSVKVNFTGAFCSVISDNKRSFPSRALRVLLPLHLPSTHHSTGQWRRNEFESGVGTHV